MFKHLLIPTDGSPLSNKAAEAGIGFAIQTGAQVTAYHTIDVAHLHANMRGYPAVRALVARPIAEIERQAGEVGQKHLDKIAKLAKLAGVPFNAVLARDRLPHEGIIGAAKKQRCDVIFMASHGRSALSAVLLGSVTQKVLAHSKIPVMVYR